MEWFGLGLPKTCFIICVKTPVTSIDRKINIESIFNFLFIFFFIKKEKTKNINEIKKYQSELPNSVIFIKNSLKYLLLGELLPFIKSWSTNNFVR